MPCVLAHHFLDIMEREGATAEAITYLVEKALDLFHVRPRHLCVDLELAVELREVLTVVEMRNDLGPMRVKFGPFGMARPSDLVSECCCAGDIPHDISKIC